MIFIQLKEQLSMLLKLLQQVSDCSFTQPIKHLEGATIGQHARHIIELLQCAEIGKKTGVVDYVNRKRNLNLESDKHLAVDSIRHLLNGINKTDMMLKLQTASQSDATDHSLVDTSYYREMVYNTEHIIHHLALIKVALIELNIFIENPNFGYAYSTLQYRQDLVIQKEA